MKTLYIDCGMGAAGDMLTGALSELLPAPDEVFCRLNSLGIPGVQIKREKCSKCGIVGTHVSLTVKGVEEDENMHAHVHEHMHEHEHEHEHGHKHEHEHEHEHEHAHSHAHVHRGMREIEDIINSLNVSEKIKKDILAVYGIIADAESRVHGVPVSDIHFHEVGTLDAVADIASVCFLMDALSPDEVVASPINVGSGHVRCAHGELPVPAPAAALILKGIPIYSDNIKGELCTPTGAALLKYFVTRFAPMPEMTANAVGYGMGRRDYERANCVRAVIGEKYEKYERADFSSGQNGNKTDSVVELSFNVDDMTAEEIGFAEERLFESGALEVFTLPAGMKKSRPGTLVCVICDEAARESIVRAIFKYTTTIGVRECRKNRYVLDRKIKTLSTPLGEIREKISEGYGVVRAKYEYSDVAAAAARHGMSIEEVKEEVKRELDKYSR